MVTSKYCSHENLILKSEKCFFIFYGCENCVYKCWSPNHRNTIRHCNMTFDDYTLYKYVCDKKSIHKEDMGVEKEIIEVHSET